MNRAKLQTLASSGRVARCTIVSSWRYLRYSHVRYVACVRHDRSRVLEILVSSLFSLILSTCRTSNTDLQIANLLGHNLASTYITAIGKRTMTVLPLVYTILSLFELILVDSPRVVAGLQGIKSSFLNDITPMSSIYWILSGYTSEGMLGSSCCVFASAVSNLDECFEATGPPAPVPLVSGTSVHTPST